MEDKELEPIVPRDILVKQALSSVAYLASGAFLMVMAFSAKFPILGIILPVLGIVVGLGAFMSKDREDKKPGFVLAVAGVLGMMIRFKIPILGSLAGFALGLGALGLFAAGIWKGIKFLLGLKSRQ